MNLDLTPELRAFREDVRAFIRAELPADIQDKVKKGLHLGKDDFTRWQKILHKKCWVSPNWPKEYGGTGWSPMQRYIFDDEIGKSGAPRVIPFGLVMVAPVIMKFGTEAQKREHLPKILKSEVWWCQGYSEPGAGSDLAGLKTRAVKEGDHYVVNGQKTWTTLAQYADWIFCLVRTDPAAKKQEGISFILVDMKSPGVSVKPIVTMDGGAEVNEVFFDNVKVPVTNLVGPENQGWTVAKYLLGHERTNIADIGRAKHQLARVKEIAAAERMEGGTLLEDAEFRDRIADVELDLIALDATILRIVAAEASGKPPGAEASLLKIKGSELQQALTELLIEAIGYYGFPYNREAMEHGWNEPPIGPDYAAPLAPAYFNTRKTTIYGGSNEVQRGILAKFVMGY
ncbi:MAG: pimeloyl-CoA dehydrogenase large subunit [Rhizobiaceae bacterium]|nr:MAG: pimeloyl-CoA dehydrogenase large subunit [Rhizobiaceae bacterium]